MVASSPSKHDSVVCADIQTRKQPGEQPRR